MNTEELLLTTLLIATIAFMLLRPFVGKRSDVAERVHRCKKIQPEILKSDIYRFSPKARPDGCDPAAVPVKARAAGRKWHRYKRGKNREVFSNR